MAVQHGDQRAQGPGAEARLEALHRLRRERNLRHEHNRALALFQAAGDGLQIDLRLPAARDAVEEEHLRQRGSGCWPTVTQRCQDHLQSLRLLLIHHERRRGQDVFVRVGIAFHRLRTDQQQPLVLESPDRVGRGLAEPDQLLHRQLAPLFEDVPDVLLLLGELRQLGRERQRAGEELLLPAVLLASYRLRQHALQGGFQRAAIVVRNPARELEHARRDQALAADYLVDRLEIGVRRIVAHRGDDAQDLARAERHLDACALGHEFAQLVGDEVVKLAAQGDFEGDPGDHERGQRPDSLRSSQAAGGKWVGAHFAKPSPPENDVDARGFARNIRRLRF